MHQSSNGNVDHAPHVSLRTSSPLHHLIQPDYIDLFLTDFDKALKENPNQLARYLAQTQSHVTLLHLISTRLSSVALWELFSARNSKDGCLLNDMIAFCPSDIVVEAVKIIKKRDSKLLQEIMSQTQPSSRNPLVQFLKRYRTQDGDLPKGAQNCFMELLALLDENVLWQLCQDDCLRDFEMETIFHSWEQEVDKLASAKTDNTVDTPIESIPWSRFFVQHISKHKE
jgi:hypothetical protein